MVLNTGRVLTQHAHASTATKNATISSRVLVNTPIADMK